jgi:hypothetical protein
MEHTQEILEDEGKIKESSKEMSEEAALGPDEEHRFVLDHSMQLKVVKYSSLACYAALLGGLLWCVALTIRPILQWRPPENTAAQMPWQVSQAYLLLGALLSLFFTVFLLAFMVPRMIVTWITTIVIDYLITKSFGRSGDRQLVRTASDFAKEISWDTFKSVAREGNLIGIGIVVLCLLPWLFGTSTVLRSAFTNDGQ